MWEVNYLCNNVIWYRGKKNYEFLSERLFFNLIIRFLLEGYLEFAINSMINMRVVNLLILMF